MVEHVGTAASAVRRATPTSSFHPPRRHRGRLPAIHDHERALTERLMAGLTKIPGVKIYGITDPARFNERCGTFAVRIDGHTPLELSTKLGDRGFFTWDGNYYALNLTEHLDVEKSGGFLRIGLVHYNTVEEVDRLLAALREIVGMK